MQLFSVTPFYLLLYIFLVPISAPWHTDYDAALSEAQEAKKPIMLVFAGSDWCKPCIKLKKEVFESEYFKEEAPKSFALLYADFPRYKKNRLSKEQQKHNQDLASRYNRKGQFPKVVILDDQGNILAESSYQAGGPEVFLQHLKGQISKP